MDVRTENKFEPLFALFDELKAKGLKVYQRNKGDSWAIFSDGARLGYVQYRPLEGFTVSTVHKPSRIVGTGYQVARHVGKVTDEMVEDAMRTICPSWDHHNAGEVRKYRDMDEYRKGSWESAYKEV
jgi:hypothetical protein